MATSELALLSDVYDRASAGGAVSVGETRALMEAGEEVLDFADLLPLTLPLDGKPMNVKNRRPMFVPLLRRKRKAQREIYLCGRQLGKTSSVAASMLMNMIFRERFRTLYVAPQAIFCNRLHHGYFGSMIAGCYLPWKIQDSSCTNNVNEKTFVGASHFHAVSMFANSNSIVGLTVDSAYFDEIQSLNLDFLPQARETLGTSEFAYETYTGTARGVENTINVLFNQSSMNRWHMRCRHCGKDNFCIDVESIKMIQRAGIGCMYCSTDARPRLLDTNDGIFIPEYPDRLKIFDGYQIPQIIVQDRIRQDHYFSRIYSKVHGIEAYPTSKVLEELMAIPSEGGGIPVTGEQIKAASILPYTDSQVPPLHEFTTIGGGVDWGGGGESETSFTVGTIVGYHPVNQRFEVLGAIKPIGTPQQHAFIPVADYFKRLVGDDLSILGADGLFVGPVQNPRLASRCGVPCASQVYGSLKTLFKAHQGDFYTVDKSTLLYVVFELIAAGKIVFPKDDGFKRFTKDLTAVIVEDIENKSNGSVSRRYARISTMPDDFLHALAYAVFACSRMVALDLTRMVGLGSNASINRSSASDIGTES